MLRVFTCPCLTIVASKASRGTLNEGIGVEIVGGALPRRMPGRPLLPRLASSGGRSGGRLLSSGSCGKGGLRCRKDCGSGVGSAIGDDRGSALQIVTQGEVQKAFFSPARLVNTFFQKTLVAEPGESRASARDQSEKPQVTVPSASDWKWALCIQVTRRGRDSSAAWVASSQMETPGGSQGDRRGWCGGFRWVRGMSVLRRELGQRVQASASRFFFFVISAGVPSLGQGPRRHLQE